MGLLRFERKSMAAETMFSPVEGVRKSSFPLIQDVQRFLNRLPTGVSTRAFTAVLRMILLNLFIPDLKRIYSKRAHTLFLYSEQYNQVIYTKQSKTKMKNWDLVVYLRRGVNDRKRVFKQNMAHDKG